MHITEIFLVPDTKAGKLFWLPEYIRLSKSVYDTYTRTGETSERSRHVGNCASRWGVTRTCAEAILAGAANIQIDDVNITITREITEE